MNDIEILEKLVERCKECKFACCEQCEINWKEVQAIENLIQENKELKEKVNVLNQEKEYLNCVIDSDNDNYIPKSKVKEKIEEIKRNDYSSYDASICLQELLEEGE